MIRPTLLMIRPENPARNFVRALETQLGRPVATLYSPLIGIEPLATNLDLTDITLLLFTSVNGVEQFARKTKTRNIPAICVGTTTQQAALKAGLVATDAGGTAQLLLAQAIARKQEKFLYICGEQTSFDLLTALRAENIITRAEILYRQSRLPLSKPASSLLKNSPAIIPIFSANGAKTLLKAIADKEIYKLTLLCISPTVTETCTRATIGTVHTARSPNRKGMIDKLTDLL